MTKTKSLLLTAGIVLATAFTFCGCKEEAKEKKETPSAVATTEATAEKDEAGVIERDILTLKDDVYYLNNVPFTGIARRHDMEKSEMKDGKLHGAYTSNSGGHTTTGTFKDGKQHGEWKNSHYFDGDCLDIENYKDGEKHGEWKYFFNGELQTTRTWKNDVLIKEWRAEIEAGKFDFLGTWKSEEAPCLKLIIERSPYGRYFYTFIFDDEDFGHEGKITVSEDGEGIVLEGMPMANLGGIYEGNEGIDFSLEDGKLVTQNSGGIDSDWLKLPCGWRYVTLEKVNN